jgi:hypothetical protein
MTTHLDTAIVALEAMTHDALSHTDDSTVFRFHQLVLLWTQRSAKETRERASRNRKLIREQRAKLRDMKT